MKHILENLTEQLKKDIEKQLVFGIISELKNEKEAKKYMLKDDKAVLKAIFVLNEKI